VVGKLENLNARSRPLTDEDAAVGIRRNIGRKRELARTITEAPEDAQEFPGGREDLHLVPQLVNDEDATLAIERHTRGE
jgi:hypothetical protein